MTERHFIPLASPFEVELAGTRLLEAGAGTGKTWTITALVLRLLLEQELEIGQILVVTYTRAATGELRGRMRARLMEALLAFETGSSPEGFLHALLSRHDHARAQVRLRLALESFDEAAIFTIHGFCQRALAETAFAAGHAFERELLTDQSELLADVARDAWRKAMAEATSGGETAWVKWLIQVFGGPAGLAAQVKNHVGRFDALLAAPPADDWRAATRDVAAAYDVARDFWRLDSAAILAWIAAARLNQQSYKPEKMQPRSAALADYFARETADLPLPKDLDHFGLSKITEKRSKSSPQPEHPFFAAIDRLLAAATRLSTAYDHASRRLLHDFLLAARNALDERKRRSGQQSYDDLLIDMGRAIQGPGAAALVHSLRARYRAALVDEFQDTDPLQLDIFSGIFGQASHPLVYVGDPKQAIYGFRGADVFAYLAARQQADAGYALLENRRSTPLLLTAVNALFERPQPFLLDELLFEAARPAPMERSVCTIEDDAAPLTLWTLAQPADTKSFTKECALAMAAEAVAADIARLQSLGRAGRAQLGARPLGGGDMAVLVRKHHQGEAVRKALARYGIASVTLGGGSVWKADAALDVERLLLALAAPTREGLVRAALTTPLWGADAGQLAVWASDEAAWTEMLGRFHDDHQLLRERGFMAMWSRLLRRENIVARLLTRPDGERRLTNYRHLAELLQTAEHTGTLDSAGLARHIARSRQAAEVDENQLRLESDAQLVRIVTIHAAKGLQYPIVYCPFLWLGPERDDQGWPVLAHVRSATGASQTVLDFGSEGIDALRLSADREDAAEELRLAYVALTRAEHRCIVAWGKVNNFARSPLAWLLFAPGEVVSGDPRTHLAELLEARDAAALQADLVTLAAGLDGAMAVIPVPEASLPAAPAVPKAPPVLSARPFNGAIPAPWQISSFTTLAARLGDVEAPDHDAMLFSQESAVPAAGHAVPPAPTFTRFCDFPRGARAGSCLHALLERCDFQGGNPLAPVVTAVLDEFAYPRDWQAVLERMVAAVVATPLNADGLCLAQIARSERLIELEFTFPHASPAGRAGYMKGFIDLVFRHAGRWYIVDYKSNWLGDRAEDYAPLRLAEVMRQHRYDLQLRIYAAALRRALALREPELDWESSFGGVFYLFLRGMGPDQPAGNGIYYTRPDQRELAEFLAREAS